MVSTRTSLLLVFLAGCVSAEGDVLRSRDNGNGDGNGNGNGDGNGNGNVDGGSRDSGSAGDNCELLPCPDQTIGMATVCGRVIDLETSLPITQPSTQVRIYEPGEQIDMATAIQPDACGRFATSFSGKSPNLVVHTGGLVAMGEFRQVISVIGVQPGQVTRVNAYVLRAATDQEWSRSAGLGDRGFAQLGAFLAIFIDVGEPPVGPYQGTPIAGVTMTVTGPASPPRQYYFADGEPQRHTQIDPDLTVTAASGAGLVSDELAPIASYGGSHPDCTFFGQSLAVMLPSAIQVQEILGTCQ
ncbi:MAG: hypothetical protein MJE77_13125 [Proteobacteria bacterium]|nr:hypothetical protein [Pseudomonadota bacterium]